MKKDEDIKKLIDSKGIVYFSKKYNDTKDVLLKSVKKWNTFKYASRRLKNDKEVVLAALSNVARRKREPDYIIKRISKRLRNDRDIMLKAFDNRIKYRKNLEKA